MAGPGDGVNRQPWLVGHARRGDAGERHDVAMQVGLVGVAGLGRDSSSVFTSGQAVGSMVEADPGWAVSTGITAMGPRERREPAG